MDAVVQVLSETINALNCDGPVLTAEEVDGLCTDIAYHVPHKYRLGMISGLGIAMSRRDKGVGSANFYAAIVFQTIVNKSNQLKALRKREG